MSYVPSTPFPPDLPANNQPEFLTNFGDLNSYFGVNHIPFGNAITNITNTNPAVVTSVNHGQVTGATIQLNRVRGLIPGRINEEEFQTVWPVTNPYTITVIDADTFSLNGFDATNTDTFPPYVITSGDFLVTTVDYPYGYHTKLFFPKSIATPNLLAPKASLYPQTFVDLTQMFFQNGDAASFILMLTGSNLVETKDGIGVKTPWGLIFNFGQVPFTGVATSYNFPLPYKNTPLSITACTYEKFKNPALVANITNNTAFTAQNGGAANSPAITGYYFCIGI